MVLSAYVALVALGQRRWHRRMSIYKNIRPSCGLLRGAFPMDKPSRTPETRLRHNEQACVPAVCRVIYLLCKTFR